MEFIKVEKILRIIQVEALHPNTTVLSGTGRWRFKSSAKMLLSDAEQIDCLWYYQKRF